MLEMKIVKFDPKDIVTASVACSCTQYGCLIHIYANGITHIKHNGCGGNCKASYHTMATYIRDISNP